MLNAIITIFSLVPKLSIFLPKKNLLEALSELRIKSYLYG